MIFFFERATFCILKDIKSIDDFVNVHNVIHCLGNYRMIERSEFGPSNYGQGSGPWQGPGEVLYQHVYYCQIPLVFQSFHSSNNGKFYFIL